MWVSQNPPKLDNFCTETHGDLGIPYFKKPPYVSICWSLVISFLARLPPLCIYRTAKINMFVQVCACLWIFGKWAPTNSLGKLQLERFPSSALWFCLSVPTSWKLFPTSCLEAQAFLGRLWGYRWHWNTYLRYVHIKWCQYARAPTYLPTHTHARTRTCAAHPDSQDLNLIRCITLRRGSYIFPFSWVAPFEGMVRRIWSMLDAG